MLPSVASWYTAWLPSPGNTRWYCHWPTEAVFPVWVSDVTHTDWCQTLSFVPQSGCSLPESSSSETPFWKSLFPVTDSYLEPFSHSHVTFWCGESSITVLGTFDIHTAEPFNSKTSRKKSLNTMSPRSHYPQSLEPNSIRHLSSRLYWDQCCQESHWPSCQQIPWLILVLNLLCFGQYLTRFTVVFFLKALFSWLGLYDIRFLAFFLPYWQPRCLC